MKIRLTLAAVRAFREYLARVDADDPSAAQAERDRTVRALHNLAAHPDLGRIAHVQGFRMPLRAWPVVGSPLVRFYSVHRAALVVHRIRHARRRSITR